MNYQTNVNKIVFCVILEERRTQNMAEDRAERIKDDLPAYYFHEGTNFKAYDYMGAHRISGGFIFRTWAPGADAVYVTGDFNNWSATSKMERVSDGGIYELKLPEGLFGEGFKYKFIIERDGKTIYKADPYAFRSEKPPLTASVFTSEEYRWHDALWMRNRSRRALYGYESAPINIYEVHLGSFMRTPDGEYLTYKQLATELATYVKQMGYTHVELMPVAEHPFDGSWGYQVCGYFAPTSRFGTPNDFAEFVDILHTAGIGVILDWVPAHFPKDAHGLYEFDGGPLYEYQGADRMEHKGWGTRCFDVGRNEIQSFLISNAAYWADKYHIDGLRVDAVASMLYLDYDRRPGEWIPNTHGTNINLEAVAFFRKLNSHMADKFPDVMMIAEESSAYPNVTSFWQEGLGFTMKWNMGWMNDSLAYVEEDPIHRKYHHDKLTFSLTYAFSEKYVLPFSHDEVVHGKKSLLDKAPVSYEDKFATTRALLTWMMTHPGKKLSFMGCEIGQFKEWDFESSVEWFLLDYPMHKSFQHFVASLNKFYLEHSQLWELDASWDGFEWLDPDNRDQSIITFSRRNKKGETLVVAINFTPVEYKGFELPVPFEGRYRCIFSSADKEYGGYTEIDDAIVSGVKSQNSRSGFGAKIDMPMYGALIFNSRKPRSTKPRATKAEVSAANSASETKSKKAGDIAESKNDPKPKARQRSAKTANE